MGNKLHTVIVYDISKCVSIFFYDVRLVLCSLNARRVRKVDFPIVHRYIGFIRTITITNNNNNNNFYTC